MDWSLQLGTIKGIKIKLHWTFFFIILWGALSYGGNRGIAGLVYGAVLTGLVFGIVLLHELGHSLVAIAFGIRVRDITLLPIGGLARLERMPDAPLQEFLVAVAGPAVNFVLATALFPFVLWMVDGSLLHVLLVNPAQATLENVIKFLFLVNVSLLVFNLIPAFPMDGGRIFRALLAMWIGSLQATRIAVWVGQGFAFVLGGYGIWSGSWVTALIALFIFSAGGAEGRAAAAREVLDRISVGEALLQMDTILSPNFTIMEVAAMALHSSQLNYPVMLGDVLIGIVRRHDIHRALSNNGKQMTVAEVMQRDFPTVTIDSSLTDAQETLFEANSSVAAVYDGTYFVGLIDYNDIDRAYRLYRTPRQGWRRE